MAQVLGLGHQRGLDLHHLDDLCRLHSRPCHAWLEGNAIGAPGNIVQPNYWTHAQITRINTDGSGREIVAVTVEPSGNLILVGRDSNIADDRAIVGTDASEDGGAVEADVAADGSDASDAADAADVTDVVDATMMSRSALRQFLQEQVADAAVERAVEFSWDLGELRTAAIIVEGRDAHVEE